MSRNVTVLSAPSNLGLKPPAEGKEPGGSRMAEVLKASGIISRLDARDAGTVQPPPYSPDPDSKTRIRNAHAIRRYSERLAGTMQSLVGENSMLLVLGGDCRHRHHPQEVADLLTHAQNESIADELALVRVMLRHLMHYLQQPIPDVQAELGSAQVPENIPQTCPAKACLGQFLDVGSRLTAVAPLVYHGAGTVAYLRQRMEPGGGMRHILEEVLDDLSANFEVDL